MVRAIRWHQLNTKTSINGSEVSRLSVAIQNKHYWTDSAMVEYNIINIIREDIYAKFIRVQQILL